MSDQWLCHTVGCDDIRHSCCDGDILSDSIKYVDFGQT